MSGVDWRMGVTVAPPRMNALEAYQQGRDQRRAVDSRNALTRIFEQQQGIGADGQPIPGYIPGAVGGGIGGQIAIDRAGGSDPWAELAQSDPEAAFRLHGQMQQQHARQAELQQRQQEQRRADLPLIGRLLDHSTNEETYQQARMLAGQYGIDVSQLPQSFGDGTWVAQQREVFKALQDPKKAEALSTAGKIAMDMGYQPGTPEFNKAVNDIWTAGEAKPYVVGGETRLYTPKIGGQGQVQGGRQSSPQGAQGDAPTYEMYRGAVNSLGPQGAAAWLKRNNLPVRVATPQEAESLPPGTRIYLPDGTEGVVP